MDKMSALRQYFTGKLHIDQPLLMEASGVGKETPHMHSLQLVTHSMRSRGVHDAHSQTRHALLLPYQPAWQGGINIVPTDGNGERAGYSCMCCRSIP